MIKILQIHLFTDIDKLLLVYRNEENNPDYFKIDLLIGNKEFILKAYAKYSLEKKIPFIIN